MMLSSSSLVRARNASTPSMVSSSRMRWSVPSAWRTTVLSRISAMRAARAASISNSFTLVPCSSRSSAQVIPSCLPPRMKTRSSLMVLVSPMNSTTSRRLSRVAST